MTLMLRPPHQIARYREEIFRLIPTLGNNSRERRREGAKIEYEANLGQFLTVMHIH